MDTHIFRGFTDPFQLNSVMIDEIALQVRPLANARVLTIKGLNDESLPSVDREWAAGLWEIGKKFGVELRLPSSYFEK